MVKRMIRTRVRGATETNGFVRCTVYTTLCMCSPLYIRVMLIYDYLFGSYANPNHNHLGHRHD